VSSRTDFFIERANLKNDRMPASKWENARRMRKEMTRAEALLWSRLSRTRAHGNPLGVRVHRQKPIYGYIVDFWISAWRVVIEVDGGYHEGQREYDAKRDAALSSLDITVLRFTNEEVERDIEGVLARIKENAR
jgi:very-short-patch-repair endonuclease